jgi:succinate dehydrogenase/fumarate reductase iron-sulfur protein
MKDHTLIIVRNLPEGGYKKDKFTVPLQPGATVLQGLVHIYDTVDSTLAFRYSCRYNHCGLCGISADGRPRLACKTKLENTLEVAPLPGLPVLRDLAVDRSRYFERFRGLRLYPTGEPGEPLGYLQEDPLHRNLMNCLECLCCVASCTPHDNDDTSFGGPYLFIRLAQLHLDPRDDTDRRAQAGQWGIDRCADCGRCVCPNGINLNGALAALLR